MALEKAKVPNTTNQQALSAQDIADSQEVLGILKNLQEVIDGGNTYGNANQTWTFDEDKIQFRDTANDKGLILRDNAIAFSDGSGNLITEYNINYITLKDSITNFKALIFSSGLTTDTVYELPNKSGKFAMLSDIVTNWSNLTNKPIKAETNLTLTGAVSIDITAKQSYIYNLTGNVDLTINTSNVANNESYVTELRVTTDTGFETLTLLNATDTKDIYGTFDPTTVNKVVISVTKDDTGNVYLTYLFNQPN